MLDHLLEYSLRHMCLFADQVMRISPFCCCSPRYIQDWRSQEARGSLLWHNRRQPPDLLFLCGRCNSKAIDCMRGNLFFTSQHPTPLRAVDSRSSEITASQTFSRHLSSSSLLWQYYSRKFMTSCSLPLFWSLLWTHINGLRGASSNLRNTTRCDLIADMTLMCLGQKDGWFGIWF